MLKSIYALRDLKGFWTDPFLESNDDSAKRGVSLLVRRNDPNNTISNFPSDFDLYEVGKYDTVSGIISFDDRVCYPRFICNAASLGGKKNED